MGAFYANICVKGLDRDELIGWMRVHAGASCVSGFENGWLCFATEDLDNQDDGLLDSFGVALSKGAGRQVCGVINHDDDVLFIRIYKNGVRVADYNSMPDYWSNVPDADAPPKLEGLPEFSALWVEASTADVERVLMAGPDEYPFATDRHSDFAAIVKLPKASVSNGYIDIVAGGNETGWTILSKPTAEADVTVHGAVIGRASPEAQNSLLSFLRRLLGRSKRK